MTMEVTSKYGNDLDTSITHSFCSCCAPSKSGVSRAESDYIHPASPGREMSLLSELFKLN